MVWKPRKKQVFNRGFSMGSPTEKDNYDPIALGMRMWLIKIEKELGNQFAECLGASAYADLDDNEKQYASSMVYSRMQHFKIDDLAKKVEKRFNTKNINKFRKKVEKMFRLKDERRGIVEEQLDFLKDNG